MTICPLPLIAALPLLTLGLVRTNFAQAPPDPTQQPIVTERPDFTDSTEVVPLRRIQLEGGTAFTRTGSEKSYTLGELLLRVSTGRRTEFRLGLNSGVFTHTPDGNTSGLEDLDVGFKVKLADGSQQFGLRRPAAALIFSTSLPTGAAAYGESNFQPSAKLCLAWNLSERFQLASNLIGTYASEEEVRFGQFSGSVSFGYDLTPRIACFCETFGFFPSERNGPRQSYLDGGFTYRVTPNYQLDTRAGFGMNATRPDDFFELGASHRW